MLFSRKDKRISMKGRRDKRMTNLVQTVRNSTKTERELVLEMRISTKRGKDVLSGIVLRQRGN